MKGFIYLFSDGCLILIKAPQKYVKFTLLAIFSLRIYLCFQESW